MPAVIGAGIPLGNTKMPRDARFCAQWSAFGNKNDSLSETDRAFSGSACRLSVRLDAAPDPRKFIFDLAQRLGREWKWLRSKSGAELLKKRRLPAARTGLGERWFVGGSAFVLTAGEADPSRVEIRDQHRWRHL